MTKKKKAAILEGAKQAFFKAMLDGYAGGENRKSIKDKAPYGHTKIITFTDGDYVVKDEWHTTPHSDKSAGTTIILYQNIPVWLMSYGGAYKNSEVISFLKKALKENYLKSVFCGGRGPEAFKEESMLYRNSLSSPRDNFFQAFEGMESIHSDDPDPKLLGYHKYFGMSLL